MAGTLIQLFPRQQRAFWENVCRQEEWLQEIRLRVDKPVMVLCKGKEYFVDEQGAFTRKSDRAHLVRGEELEALLDNLSHDSLYAFEEELRQGFLTVAGGHRVGVAGQAVLEGGVPGGALRTVKHIAYLNIRVAHQLSGVADPVMPLLYRGEELLNTLIISPPGCGKTTLLRDIIRQVSDGSASHRGLRVGVVDERSEIAGSYLGHAQNDVGIRTDVLDACPKAAGVMLLLRSMSPEVIAVDELGGEEDVRALHMAACSGSRILATVHGERIADYQNKFGKWETDAGGLFDLFLLLGREGGKPVFLGAVGKEEGYAACAGGGDDRKRLSGLGHEGKGAAERTDCGAEAIHQDPGAVRGGDPLREIHSVGVL